MHRVDEAHQHSDYDTVPQGGLSGHEDAPVYDLFEHGAR